MLLHFSAHFLLERLKLQTNKCCIFKTTKLHKCKKNTLHYRRIWGLLYNEARWWKVIYIHHLSSAKRKQVALIQLVDILFPLCLTSLSHHYHWHHCSTSPSNGKKHFIINCFFFFQIEHWCKAWLHHPTTGRRKSLNADLTNIFHAKDKYFSGKRQIFFR